MPVLTPYTNTDLEDWDLEEIGVRDGSSPGVQFSRDGAVGTRRFRCLWEHRFDACRFFLGDVSSYTDGGGVVRMSRLLPQVLPDRAEFAAVTIPEAIRGWKYVGRDDPPGTRVTAKDAVWTPTSQAAYEYAEFSVQYERVPFGLLDDAAILGGTEQDRYVQYIPGESSADYLTQPGGTQYYLTPDGSAPHKTSVPYATGVVDPVFRFRLKWHRVSYSAFYEGSALWDRIFGTDSTGPWLGGVNLTDFHDFAAGTVLLEDVRLSYAPDVLGDAKMNWTIDYGFAVKPIGGWNKSWRFPPAGPGLAASKKYLVGRGETWYVDTDPATPDGYLNYNKRDFADFDYGLFGF